MILPNGTELAWFLSGMWATIFVLRAGRASQSGFFAVLATLVLAVLPAVGILFHLARVAWSARMSARFG